MSVKLLQKRVVSTDLDIYVFNEPSQLKKVVATVKCRKSIVIIMNINSSTGVKQMFSLKVQYIYNEEN